MSKYIPDINDFNNYPDDVFVHRKGGGGTLKSIVAFLLGVIIGLLGFFGGIFAAGKLVLSQPIGSTIEQIDTSVSDDLYSLVFGTDEEHSGFLNASYAEKTFADLFGDLGKAAEEIVSGKGSISSLSAILPILTDKITAVTDGLTEAIGIPVDNEALMTIPLSGIGDFFLDTLQNAKAGDILFKFAEGELNALMMYFCYGEEGVDYDLDPETGRPIMREGHHAITIQGLFGADFTAQIQNIPLANIIGDGDTTAGIMLSLLYGSENRYTVNEDGTFKAMNQVEYTVKDNKFYDDKDKEVGLVPTAVDGVYTIVVDDQTQYVKAENGKYLVYNNAECTDKLLYKKTTLTTLDNVGDIIDGIYLDEFVTAGDSKILQSIVYIDGDLSKPRKVSDLTKDMDSIINNMHLTDIVEIDDSNAILKAIAYKTVDGEDVPRTINELTNDMGDIINNLTLDAIIDNVQEGSILEKLVYETDENGEFILVDGKKVSRTITELTDDMDGIIDNMTLDTIIDNVEEGSILEKLVYKTDENGAFILENGQKVSRTITSLTSGMDEIIDNLYLIDVIGIPPEGSILEDIAYKTVDGVKVPLKISELGSEADTLVDNLSLSEFITAGDNAILKAIVYKEDGITSRTLGELKQEGTMDSVINGIKLSDVITAGDNKILQAIVGDGRTLGELKNADTMNTVINGIKLSDVITAGDNKILQAIVGDNRTFGDMQSADTMNTVINTIKLSDIITAGDNKVLQAIIADGRTLGDMQSADTMNGVINSIKLSDIITVGDNKVLQAIVADGRTLGDMQNASTMDGVINSIKLSDIITAGDNKVLQAIVADGRTLGDMQNASTMDSVIDNITLSDIIPENKNNAIIMFLLHGKKGLHYDLGANGAVVYKQRTVTIENGKLYNEYNEVITGATLNGTSSYTLDGTTYYLGLVSGTTNTYNVYSNSAKTVAVYYGPTTIGDMSGSNNPINKLTKSLTLAELMGDEVDGNTFLKHVSDKTIDELPEALNNLTIQQVFEDEVYTANGELNGVWRYLLIDPATGTEKEYKLTEMSTLMNNMTSNVHDASLNNLAADGIIEINGSILTQDVKEVKGMLSQTVIYTPPANKSKIGDLSVTELLVYFEAVLSMPTK